LLNIEDCRTAELCAARQTAAVPVAGARRAGRHVGWSVVAKFVLTPIAVSYRPPPSFRAHFRSLNNDVDVSAAAAADKRKIRARSADGTLHNLLRSVSVMEVYQTSLNGTAGSYIVPAENPVC